MRIKFIVLLAIFGLGIVIFSGCSSVPLATKQDDQAAKQFQHLSDNASVYVFRDQIFFGAGATISLFLDKKLVGGISDYTFYKLDIPPGKHELDVSAGGFATLLIQVEKSHVYFVRLNTLPGISLVDEGEGKKQILKCNLIGP